MKKVHDIIQQAVSSISSGPHVDKAPHLASMMSQQANSMKNDSKPLPDYDARIDILFARLGAIYGQLWWSNYRTESLLALAKQQWSEALKRFDNEILKEVLALCREHKNYPPVLPQFVETCRAAQARRITPPTKTPYKGNRDFAKAQIAAIKKMLAHS